MIFADNLNGQRLDAAVVQSLRMSGREVSVREVREALRAGIIRINGRVSRPGTRVLGGEAVDLTVFLPRSEASLSKSQGQHPEVAILYEDERVIALDKPSGWPTAPLTPSEGESLLGVAIKLRPEVAEAGPVLEGGLVHRLDGGTSGVVLFAKTLEVRAELRNWFSLHRVDKVYQALVGGEAGFAVYHEDDTEWVLDAPIGAARGAKKVRVLHPEAPLSRRDQRTTPLSARTVVRVLERFGNRWAKVEAFTRTGRRHQVRAHLADAGIPVLGDALYGPYPDSDQAGGPSFDPRIDRLCLHAASVTWPGGPTVQAPWPPDLQAIENQLRQSAE
jgi:23S rRNA pseudouridine1911/1915/1917 synthase